MLGSRPELGRGLMRDERDPVAGRPATAVSVRVSSLAILLLVAFPLGGRAQSRLDLLQSIR